MGIEGGVCKHFEEVGPADVVGAGAGDEDAAGPKHFQSAQVELLVAAQGSVEVALGFGEGGRVEDDGVVAAVGGRVVLEQIKGVGLDPLDFVPVEKREFCAAFWSATSSAGRELSTPVTCEQRGAR